MIVWVAPHAAIWLAQAAPGANDEVPAGTLALYLTFFGVIVTGVVTVVVAFIQSRTNRKVETTKQEIKDDNAAFRVENTEQHGTNVLALVNITHRQEVVIASLARLELNQREMRQELTDAVQRAGRIEDRQLLHDERLLDIEKNAKAAAIKIGHVEGEFAEYLNHGEKVRDAIVPALPPEIREAVEKVPKYRQRNRPRRTPDELDPT